MADSLAAAINQLTSPTFVTTAISSGNRVELRGTSSLFGQRFSRVVSTLQARFDSGPILTVSKPGAGFADGQTIHIRDDQNTTQSFEFERKATRAELNNTPVLVDPTATAISYTDDMSASEMAERIADAINRAVIASLLSVSEPRSLGLDLFNQRSPGGVGQRLARHSEHFARFDHFLEH